MKSIFWKEFHELKIPLLIQMAFGVLVCLVLAYFKHLETASLAIVLFVFATPVFCLLAGLRTVAPEIKANTFPWLIGMPVSRRKIWAAKFLISALYCFILYGFYAGLTFFSDISILGLDVFNFYSQSVTKLPLRVVFFSTPIFFLSLGICTSLLASPLNIIVLGLFLTAGLSALVSGVAEYFNFFLALGLISISLLFSSYQGFLYGELLDSWKKSLRALVTLIFGLSLSLLIWCGFDKLAEESFRIDPRSFRNRLQFARNPETPIIDLETHVPWWDPIQDRNHMRIVRFLPNKKIFQKIGKRKAFGLSVSPGGRYLAAQTLDSTFGIPSSFNLVLFDLENNDKEILVAKTAYLTCFINESELIYSNITYKEASIQKQIFRHTIGSGSSPIFAFESQGYRQWEYLKSLNSLYFHPSKKRDDGFLVNIDTKKLTKVNFDGRIFRNQNFSNGVLCVKFLDEKGEFRSFHLLKDTGEVSDEPWIPSSTVFIGKLSEDSFLGRIPRKLSQNDSEPETWDVVSINLATKSVEVMTSLDMIPRLFSTFKLNRTGRFMIFEVFTAHPFDLKTGKRLEPHYVFDTRNCTQEKVPLDLERPDFFILEDGTFFIRESKKLYIFNPENMTVKSLGELS